MFEASHTPRRNLSASMQLALLQSAVFGGWKDDECRECCSAWELRHCNIEDLRLLIAR